MITQRTQLTSDLIAELSQIKQENGYLTNIGERVFVGTVNPGAIELPCVVVVPGPHTETLESSSNIEISYLFRGFVDRKIAAVAEYTAGPSDEWVLADAIMSDLTRAMDDGACTRSSSVAMSMDGAEPEYSENAGTTVGASMRYRFTTPYIWPEGE